MRTLLLILALPAVAFAQDANEEKPAWSDVTEGNTEAAAEPAPEEQAETTETTEARLAVPVDDAETEAEVAPEPIPEVPEPPMPPMIVEGPEGPALDPMVQPAEPHFSIDYRTGYVNNDWSPLYDLVDSNIRLNGRGVRVGYRVIDRLQLQGSWHHARSGSTVEVEGSDSFATAFFGNTFSLGARVDANLGGIILPYAQVDGSLLWGQTRFDTQPNRDNPEGQLSWNATALGVTPAAGTEIRVPQGNLPGTVALFVEMGHTFRSQLEYENLGSIDTSGFSLHGGFGLRF